MVRCSSDMAVVQSNTDLTYKKHTGDPRVFFVYTKVGYF